MDKNNSIIVFDESITYNAEFGKGDTVPVDQQPVLKFNIDPSTGCPMSDLTCLLRSQGLERERMLANLEEFRADYLPEDISDEQALKFLAPRLAQLPSELAEHVEFVTSKRLEEQKKLAEQKELEDFKKSLLEKEDEHDVEPN